MNSLSVELGITEDCNLGCEYCYVNRRAKHMSKEEIDLFLDSVGKIMDIYNCNSYNIAYFGGEPLMNWEVLKYAQLKFEKDPRCQNTVIISNFLLLNEEMANFLQNRKLGYSFSFDGLWNENNRPLVSGESSLKMYLEKKDLILNTAGNYGCKVMVNPKSILTMTENLEFLVEEYGIQDPDYSLVRDDIWSKEDLFLFDIEITKLADRVMTYINEGKKVLSFFKLPIIDLFAGANFGKRPFSCFAGCHGVGYLPDGLYYPCMRFGSAKDHLIYDAINDVMYNDNIQELLNPRFHNPQTYPKCQNCTLYKYCNSGCHYSQMNINSKGEVIGTPVDSVCKLFRMIYRESMRITEELKDNHNFQNIIVNNLKQYFSAFF